MNPPDPALLQIFAAEQADHLQRMRSIIATLEDPTVNTPVLEEFLRRAHTLKGASRAAGFEPTEMLMHSLESAFATLRRSDTVFTPSVRALCFRVLDAAEDILTAILAGRPAPSIERLVGELSLVTGGPSPILASASESVESSSSISQFPAAGTSPEFVRIKTSYLDELMSASSELVASSKGSNQESTVLKEVEGVEAAVREWARLQRELAPFLRLRQSDPEFASAIECIQAADRHLKSLLSEVRSEASSRRQADWERQRLANRLDEAAFQVRMVSADTAFGGFGPMLRGLAEEDGKEIEYHVDGLEQVADRVLLQALKDPLMHLLRNALTHGVERPAERRSAGKSPTGTIRLLIRSQGDRLQMTVEDDGKGIDRQAVINEAVQSGFLPDADSARSMDLLGDLIFRPGFSTSSALTKMSGRGMGLHIVQHDIARLHGEIEVHSEHGKGTAISLTLPLSVSSQRVLLVAAAGGIYGILTSSIQQIYPIQRSEIQLVDGHPTILFEARPIRVVRLSDLLNISEKAIETDACLQTVLVTVSGRTFAVAVDSFLDVRDAVIKPLGLPLGSAGFTAGALALADGEIALVLKLADILSRFRDVRAVTSHAFSPLEERGRTPTILVVDDSMTTRALEKGLLEAHGYEVRVAVDGVEALAVLRHQPIDLVITDLMMPRMDGFKLLEEIRKDKALTLTPVIIVSSMESREDQERGLSLGADAYITKRKFDQRDLLEAVRQIL